MRNYICPLTVQILRIPLQVESLSRELYVMSVCSALAKLASSSLTIKRKRGCQNQGMRIKTVAKTWVWTALVSSSKLNPSTRIERGSKFRCQGSKELIE